MSNRQSGPHRKTVVDRVAGELASAGMSDTMHHGIEFEFHK
jgi:hypothetical protein